MADPAVPSAPRALDALRDLLGQADRQLLILVLALMFAAALTEGVGIVMLVPMLALLGGEGAAMGGLGGKIVALFGGPWTLGGILTLFLILVALRALVQHGQAVLGVRLQHEIVDRIRQRLFAALIKAEWRWLAGGRASDHVATLVVNVGRVGNALNQLLTLAAAAVTAAVYLTVVFLLSWQVALVALAGGAVALAGFGRHRRLATRLGQDLNRANRALQASVGDALAGMRTTRIFGREDRQIADFDATLAELRDQQRRYAASASHGRAAMQIGGALLLAALVWLGAGWWAVPVATLLPILVVFARLVPMLGTIQQGWHFWLHSAPAAIEAKALYTDAAAHAEAPAPASAERLRLEKAITLERVGFTYVGRNRPALTDISLTLPVRTTTAIVGASGAGKSSLADLLMGLISPDRGTMLVDGQAIDGPLRQIWRRSVAYVEQDSFLFHGSIRANLLWAAPEASDDALHGALTMAAADFVFDLPAGLDTTVGDAGVQLSGGERQRIGLARALLAEPQLLILDEATSALDAANEAAVQRAVAAMRGQVTLVLIGHRPSILELADRTIRLDGGRILPEVA